MADPGSGGKGAGQLVGAGAGAGLGILKWLGDIQANKNDRAVAATQNKWAPLLGQANKDDVRKANFLKELVQGALSGAQSGKGMEKMWQPGEAAAPAPEEASLSPWTSMTGNESMLA